jgi:hypothetical protein
MTYIPMARPQGQGFYNPNMPGPDWSQGISGILNQIVAATQYQEQEGRKRYEWEEEQRLAEQRAETYDRYIDTQIGEMTKEPPDPMELLNKQQQKDLENIAIAYPNLSPQQHMQIYLQGGKIQGPPAPDPAQITRVGSFTKRTFTNYQDELKRLRNRREDLYERAPEEPETPGLLDPARVAAQKAKWQRMLAEIDKEIANLEKVIPVITRIDAETTANKGQISGANMNLLSKIAAGMKQAKVDPTSFLGQMQTQPMSPMPSTGGAPTGGVPPEILNKLPPDVRKAIEDNPGVDLNTILEKYDKYLREQEGGTGNI